MKHFEIIIFIVVCIIIKDWASIYLVRQSLVILFYANYLILLLREYSELSWFIYSFRDGTSTTPPFETVKDNTGRIRRRVIFSDGLDEEDSNDNEEDSDTDESMSEEESEEETSHEIEPPRKKSKVCELCLMN